MRPAMEVCYRTGPWGAVECRAPGDPPVNYGSTVVAVRPAAVWRAEGRSALSFDAADGTYRTLGNGQLPQVGWSYAGVYGSQRW